jgi:peptide deformylase
MTNYAKDILMVQPINTVNNEAQFKILKTPAEKGDLADALALLPDLRDTATEHEDTCAGLASTQIWTDSERPAPHIFIIKIFGTNLWRTFINATSKRSGKRITSKEGCLSKPDYHAIKNRRDRITVSYLDEQGKVRVETYGGLSSIVIQHELDHLTGALI